MDIAKARILLAAVFVARGTSFLFSKILLQNMSPMSIIGVRFVLSFLILAALFPKKLRDCSRVSLKGGVLLGILYTLCMVFEMFGLRLIDSGVSALVEHTAIVMVPVFLAVLTRKLPKRKTMFSTVLAFIGVGLLSVTQGQSPGGAFGIVLSLFAAVTFACAIIVTGRFSREGDPITIGMIQLGTMGVLCVIAAFAARHPELPKTPEQWVMMLLLVLLCSCFGFAFQPLAQKYVPEEETAVMTVVNPLTATILGIIAAHESVSVSKVAGAVLVLSALFIYNMGTGAEGPEGTAGKKEQYS